MANTKGMGYKLELHRIGTVWFFRIAIVAATLLCQPTTFAQTPGITVANGTASLSWPLTAYYYLLQSTTNLAGSNSWFNIATATPISSAYWFIIPGENPPVGTVPIIKNIVGNNFVITQSTANAQQFFRLKAPVIPIFSFAIFYDGVLEFTQSGTMVINGCVHANGPICTGTSASLTFNDTVTTTGTITSPTRDGVTPTALNENTAFNGQPPYVTNVPAFLSPFGIKPLDGTKTNHPHALIEIPPANEDPNSSLGQFRLYNQAQVLLMVTNLFVPGLHVTPQVTFTIQQSILGALPGADPSKTVYTYIWTNSIFTNLSLAIWANEPHGIENFLSLTNTFTDKREYQTNLFVTQIDVLGYSNWLGTNGFNTTKLGSGDAPTILYVADQRNVWTNKLAVVRLVNGNSLPNNGGLGWTVATQNPLYIKGNYNITQDGIHFATQPNQTTNSGTWVPAALLCDAITILSSAWNDSTSSNTFATASGIAGTGTSTATNTVNAAVITGNVPSTGTTATNCSGGVHNLMRLQEDWTGVSLVLNSSIVVLWSSQMATNQFRNPVGWSPAPINPYYDPPTRLWGLDPNFYNPAKLPPGTPVCTLP